MDEGGLCGYFGGFNLGLIELDLVFVDKAFHL
jgi:hypothetical protein